MTEGEKEYWFKPKRHGYGATPSHWKGWAVTAAFAIVLPLLSLPWLLSLSDDNKLLGVAVWAVAVIGAVWRFTEFAKKKTDGEWLWRWNGKPYRDMLNEQGKD